MSSKIRILDEHTINKIAAGEVIENPASVVKELVENSLDAGANDICVEIKGGGRELIRVSDNGHGMNGDDALLCLERHATSKIKAVDDIDSLMTMGFRGEAIPSIASISKFTLMTCPVEKTDSEQGTMVIVEGGHIVKCVSIVKSQGTTIEVKDLFFNVPVRKKFQKSPNYDANDVLKVVSMMALTHPQVKFQLINNQKTALLVSPVKGSIQEMLSQRVKSVLGEDFIKGMSWLDHNKEEYKIFGFISLPSFTRPNKTGQHLFINRRPVVSALVNFSVREGYGTTLSPNRHPLYVLYLDVPGSFIDVNVHPQKREVRLRQEQLLKNLVVEAIDKSLQESGFTLSFNDPMGEVQPISIMKSYFSRELSPLPTQESKENEIPLTLRKIEKDSTNISGGDFEIFSKISIPAPAKAKIMGIIEKYILIDGFQLPGRAKSLCLIDQRAAHSRIIFERLLKGSEKETLILQTLLIPYTFKTTLLEAVLIKENLQNLNEIGIKIHEIGSETFLIDALPQVFGNIDVQALVDHLVQRMPSFKETSLIHQEKIKQIAIDASRAAISSKQLLSMEEAQSLVDQLLMCQNPFQCPMGSSTIARFDLQNLEKLFHKFPFQASG